MIADDGKQAASPLQAHSEGQSDKPANPALDRAIQARIGDRLRAMYDTLSEEPVPDRLAAILARLETEDRGPAQ